MPLAYGAFETDEYLGGVFKLGPGAVKDLESVGSCAQVRPYPLGENFAFVFSCNPLKWRLSSTRELVDLT